MKVVSSTGDEVYFKIKRSTKLSKLQAAYANKVGKDVGSIRYVLFLFVLPCVDQANCWITSTSLFTCLSPV